MILDDSLLLRPALQNYIRTRLQQVHKKPKSPQYDLLL